jgi:hypothetical protein
MKHPICIGIGAFLAGFPLLCVWWAAVVISFNHDLANAWLVAFLLQALLGLILGALHRWAYLPIAAGMMLTVLA